MAIPVHVISADWTLDKESLQRIREEVFIIEQHVPREIEWDGEDEHSTHFMAINEIGEPLGCARLLPSGQIGRMAVLQRHRGAGIGALLLEAAVQAASQLGHERVFLHAQSYAETFYRKGGFLPYGEEFMEAGIAHIAMEMKLPLGFTPPAGLADTHPEVRKESPRTAAQHEATSPRRFNGLDDACDALCELLNNAKRRLLLLNPFLEHELFDRECVVDAISKLARSAPAVEIRIIVFDTKLLIDRSHRLVELARRLDEKISIQVYREVPNAQTSSFACVDLDGYWLLPSYEKYEGISDLDDPVNNQRLTDAFRTSWEKSRQSSELRTLRI